MHTLAYVRRSPQFDSLVLSYATTTLCSTQVTTVSEYPGRDLHIDMNESRWDHCSATQAFVKETLALDRIIFRDRVLRNTPFKDALVLIRRATGNILKILGQKDYDALVTYPVDNYVMDILMQVAQSKNIKCYGVSNFFVQGLKRLTLYGEHCPHRSPSEEEVNLVLGTLRGDFRSHMAPRRVSAILAGLRRYVRYKGRYVLFYLLYAKLLGRKEYDFLATPYNTTVRNGMNFLVERHFRSISEIDFERKSIFIPLHYFPEATIEYWSGCPTQIEFEDMLKCKIDEISDRYEQIILKEHPSTIYDNDSKFYRSLMENPKVVFVDAFVSTSDLLQYVDVVGCWTGNAGVEALVNGKSVELFLESQYYMQAMDQHPEIVKKDGPLVSISDPYVFVEEILKGCFPYEA